jgi:hypothetical protein
VLRRIFGPKDETTELRELDREEFYNPGFKGQEILSLFQNINKPSAVQPDSHSMGTGFLSWG